MSSSSSSSSTSASSSASSTSGTGGQTGRGGSGGSGTGGGWPTCDAPEPGAVQKTLHQIWQDDPAQPTEVWVPGVYVTGVAKSGCQAGVACQLFVQQSEQYADLAAGSQQSIKLFVSANAAQHFVGIKVGDRVDVDAFAWRYTLSSQHELLLQVNLQLKGCAKVVGTGNPQPVTVQLSDLTLSAYEDTVGPLLVKVLGVSGKPQMPMETFGLWKTGTFTDAGPDTIVSLSPYFLATGAFAGLQTGKVHDFTEVVGVFGLFSPTSDPTAKYKEIYPRVDAEYPVLKVH
ncbi:MAG: hypothetical protein QM820_57775 [Minicystis sp.]